MKRFFIGGCPQLHWGLSTNEVCKKVRIYAGLQFFCIIYDNITFFYKFHNWCSIWFSSKKECVIIIAVSKKCSLLKKILHINFVRNKRRYKE